MAPNMQIEKVQAEGKIKQYEESLAMYEDSNQKGVYDGLFERKRLFLRKKNNGGVFFLLFKRLFKKERLNAVVV